MKIFFYTTKHLLFLSILFGIFSCGSEPKTAEKTEDTTQTTAATPTAEVTEAQLSQGFQLMESNCFSCHSPNASMDSRVAPPMAAVKKHYLTEGISKEAFITAMVAFVKNPSEQNAKMPGAIEKFGLMPKMNFSEEELRNIAEYIYANEIEAPDWFEKHYEQEKKKYSQQKTDKSYQEIGVEYVMATKAVLGKNLLNAINTKGTEGAMEFCNVKAYPLTDSMSTVSKANIKRVSDKNRNPNNAANEMELAYIKEVQKMIAEGKEPKPKTTEINGKMLVYAPITTNKMCLQCHGDTNKDISSATLAKINKLYPQDKATGYKENELRGIWVVTLDKK